MISERIFSPTGRCAFGALGLAIALVGVIGLAAAADLDGQGEEATAQRRHGGGFEFRRRPPTIDNPYCAIATYVVGDFPQQATSAMDESGRPVIALDASILRSDLPYAHFLMAHECCHHTLGHVRLTATSELGHLGPQPFYYIRPLLKTMELDADGCAVKMLKSTHELAAIEAARTRMLEFGNASTGAYYPTGVERADGMTRAAAGK